MLRVLRLIQAVLRAALVPLVIAFGACISVAMFSLYTSILPRVVKVPVDPFDQRAGYRRPVGPMRRVSPEELRWSGKYPQPWMPAPEIIETPIDSPPTGPPYLRKKTPHFMPTPEPSEEDSIDNYSNQ